MITITRTNAENKDFQQLIIELDIYLNEIDKESHCICESFNKIDNINHTVVAYINDKPAVFVSQKNL